MSGIRNYNEKKLLKELKMKHSSKKEEWEKFLEYDKKKTMKRLQRQKDHEVLMETDKVEAVRENKKGKRK